VRLKAKNVIVPFCDKGREDEVYLPRFVCALKMDSVCSLNYFADKVAIVRILQFRSEKYVLLLHDSILH
jgi:hypothetical protein